MTQPLNDSITIISSTTPIITQSGAGCLIHTGSSHFVSVSGEMPRIRGLWRAPFTLSLSRLKDYRAWLTRTRTEPLCKSVGAFKSRQAVPLCESIGFLVIFFLGGGGAQRDATSVNHSRLSPLDRCPPRLRLRSPPGAAPSSLRGEPCGSRRRTPRASRRTGPGTPLPEPPVGRPRLSAEPLALLTSGRTAPAPGPRCPSYATGSPVSVFTSSRNTLRIKVAHEHDAIFCVTHEHIHPTSFRFSARTFLTSTTT